VLFNGTEPNYNFYILIDNDDRLENIYVDGIQTYYQIGDVVNVNGSLNLTVNNIGTNYSFVIILPVGLPEPINTSPSHVNGTVTGNTNGNSVSGVIFGQNGTTQNKSMLNFDIITSQTTVMGELISISFTFTYQAQ